MSDTPTRTWTDLPHPFTATGPICRECGGYGRTVEPGGFAARCETCDGSGLEPLSIALESAAD